MVTQLAITAAATVIIITITADSETSTHGMVFKVEITAGVYAKPRHDGALAGCSMQTRRDAQQTWFCCEVWQA